MSKKKRFEHISIKEGLSQSAINCIMQDSKGFMWFGTQDGLNRYDGYGFTVYRNEQGNSGTLVKNWINAIYESPHAPGILWIGTSAGLCTYNYKTDTFAVFSNILGNEPVNAIIEDIDGYLWFGSTDEGLVKFDQKKVEIRYKNNATVLMNDSEGNIWIGLDKGGLSKLNTKSGNIITYLESPTGLIDNRVLALFCDQDGDIWIGTDGGGLILLHKDKNNKEIFTHFPATPNTPGGLNNGHVKTIIQDRSGLLWIGTNGGGLSCLQKETKRFISYTKDPNNSYSLSHNDIEVIFEDKAGSLWIGTQGEGINKIDSRYDNFALYQYEPYNPNGLKHEKIWSIVEGKDGHFWIGTDGGVYNFDIRADKFTHIKHNINNPNSLLHNQVLSICEDRAGNLWLGTDGGGLYKYTRAGPIVFHYTNDPQNPASLSNDRILSIIQDSSGVLWFGTDGGGISCLNPNEPRNKYGKKLFFTRYTHKYTDPCSLSHNQVFTIYEDKNKTVWVGTRGGGLNRFDPAGKCFQHFENDPGVTNSLSDNSILSIIMDSTETLWIGTVNGLNQFDIKNEKWTRYTKKNGLPNNVIYGILEENFLPGGRAENLWISTNMGLSRFNISTGKFKNYDAQDGLQSNEFNTNAYTKSKRGIMFFGGIKGFNVFDPLQIKDNSYAPPVTLTDFYIANEPVPISPKGNSPLKVSITETQEIHLSYLQNSFSFGFIALNYVQPAKNRYKYRLEGYNDDWIYQETRQMVFYTKVPAGRYVFRVKGSNNDGVWNEKGAAVTLYIAPPFWLSWWFLLLMTVLLMGFLFLLHKRRTTHIKEKLEKAQLEKELQLKADFTAMLVHDLRSPLTAIVGYAQMMEEMPLMVDMHKTGKVISRSCDNMLRLINDMLDLSKFEAGKMALNKSNASVYGIIRDNLEVMMPLIKKKAIKLVWEPSVDVKEVTLLIDPEKIGQVLNNLLSNAIKFVPDNGKGNITITLSRFDNQYMEVSVSNNGPIVPVADRESLFDMYAQLNLKSRVKGTGLGLAVSKVIIESHGGIINYRPGENGVGSTFYFRLPISHESY
ncbi:MAG TPA: two-component regulator propeller domain-containing protein [Candidatus Deferrimicrobium sp.]|nr:two-component regulator propeller domain-containing protein [Candidatus Deferrimicrobium sp.]